MVRWQKKRKSFISKHIQSQTTVSILRGCESQNETEDIRGTLYFLHGGGADDRQLVDFGAMDLIQGDLLARFKELGLQIVLPSIGESFLREARPGEALSHSDYFLREVLPLAEQGTRTTPQTRWIAGLSMGGQAALNLFFRKPDLFQGAAAHFPTLIDFDYLSLPEIVAFAGRTRLTEHCLEILISEMEKAFPERAEFRKHDPLSLASHADPAAFAGKSLYFDVGTEDQFGLHEGAAALHRILDEKKIAHCYDLVQGGKHDGQFVASQFRKLLKKLVSG